MTASNRLAIRRRGYAVLAVLRSVLGEIRVERGEFAVFFRVNAVHAAFRCCLSALREPCFGSMDGGAWPLTLQVRFMNFPLSGLHLLISAKHLKLYGSNVAHGEDSSLAQMILSDRSYVNNSSYQSVPLSQAFRDTTRNG